MAVTSGEWLGKQEGKAASSSAGESCVPSESAKRTVALPKKRRRASARGGEIQSQVASDPPAARQARLIPQAPLAGDLGALYTGDLGGPVMRAQGGDIKTRARSESGKQLERQ